MSVESTVLKCDNMFWSVNLVHCVHCSAELSHRKMVYFSEHCYNSAAKVRRIRQCSDDESARLDKLIREKCLSTFEVDLFLQ